MIDIHLNVRVDAIKYYLYTLRKPVLNTFPQMTFEQYVHQNKQKKQNNTCCCLMKCITSYAEY